MDCHPKVCHKCHHYLYSCHVFFHLAVYTRVIKNKEREKTIKEKRVGIRMEFISRFQRNALRK